MNRPLSIDFRVEPADYQTDFQDLRRVREPVYVIEQNVPIELEWDALDPLCHHVIARDADNRAIGTGRLTPEGKIGRMAFPSASPPTQGLRRPVGSGCAGRQNGRGGACGGLARLRCGAASGRIPL